MRPIPAEAKLDTAEGFQLGAPIGGWNARDPIARMAATDALVMDNMFPSPVEVELRQGYAANATVASGGQIESLLGLAKLDGTFKRFAANGSGIWDITAGGAIGAVSSAATTGRWEHIQITVANVSYLWTCAGDGVNKSRIFDGTSGLWTLLDGASVPALTGVTSQDVTNVSLWKHRIILCLRQSLKFAYGPLTSVAGAFNLFDLGQVFKRGGYLVATANWTLDAGNGPDDRFVAISSEGEVAIYQGTDPSAAATFNLVGVYDVGKPVGKRCFVKLGGDLGVLTEQGLWPLSKALQSATIDRKVALTNKIQGAFSYYYNRYGSQYGWQPVLLPKGPAMLVNVPLGQNRSYQFVMNTLTGAWCRFTNWDANCMLVLDGRLFYAVGTTVREGWTGRQDGSAAITGTAAQAFTYGPSKARQKQVNLVRPIADVSSPVSFGLALDTDFKVGTAGFSTIEATNGAALWDSSLWDAASWGYGTTTLNSWRTVSHTPGKAFSLRLQLSAKGIAFTWSATDFVVEVGGLGP